MKSIILSLIVLSLELTICLISPQWRLLDVQNSEICFKPFLNRFNATSLQHNALHIGPLFSSRLMKMDNSVEHFGLNHSKVETALLISGIALIFMCAALLSVVECFGAFSLVKTYRHWFYFGNAVILTVSLLIMLTGFYKLQHNLQQPMNGSAAFGFLIGILFVVMLITHSILSFWMNITNSNRVKTEKILE